jgi:hypothetical protein
MLPPYPEDGNSMSIRRVGEFLPDYEVLHPRRQLSTLHLTLSGTNYVYFMLLEIPILNCDFLKIVSKQMNLFLPLFFYSAFGKSLCTYKRCWK